MYGIMLDLYYVVGELIKVLVRGDECTQQGEMCVQVPLLGTFRVWRTCSGGLS